MSDGRRAWTELPVIRAGVRLGGLRLLRLFTAVVILGSSLVYLSAFRPDLAHPTDIATDTSNYLAAGQRIAQGHDLYALRAGDRPAPADNAPYWSVPLLAPPPIAVAWAGLQLGPPAFMMQLWWLGAVAAVYLFAALLTATLPAAGLVVLCLLSYPMAEIAWSGNVTAYTIPAMGLTWWLTSPPVSRRSLAVAGVLVGLIGLVRITPLALGWWFVLRRQPSAMVATALVVIASIGLSALIAGPSAWTDFVSLAQGEARPTGWSFGGLIRAITGDGPLVSAAPALLALIGILGATAARHRPRVAFALLVATAALATPALRTSTLGLLVACLAPWASMPVVTSDRKGPAWVSVVAAGLALMAGAAVLAAQVPQTTFTIRNEATAPIVVRLQMIVGTASFGFEVPQGAEGSAWVDQPGGMPALLQVFDGSCRLMDAQRVIVRGDLVEVGSEEVAILEVPAGPTGDALPYTDSCVGSMEPTRP